MKNLIFGSVVLISLAAAGPAIAADAPVRAPIGKAPIMAAPSYNWTGLYVGAQAGVQWFEDDFSDPARIGGPVIGSFDASGLLVGVHAGYNFQVGSYVFGVEGDYEWTNAKGSGIGFLLPATPFVIGTAEQESQASIRGRLGYAFGPTLFYVTGGATFGHFTFGYNFPIGALPRDDFSKTLTGWTVGGGAEIAFQGAPNWSARAEYRYTDFGDASSLIINCCAPPPSSQRHEIISHSARIAVSYRFGELWGKGPVGKGPVVAAY